MKKTVEIHIAAEEDEQTVSVSIAGLAESAALAVIERANAEAMKLLTARAARRRFKHPVATYFFDSEGKLMLKCAEGRPPTMKGSERGEPRSIMLQDVRGRKASVRLEITK
jgi:hypothetical protein